MNTWMADEDLRLQVLGASPFQFDTTASVGEVCIVVNRPRTIGQYLGSDSLVAPARRASAPAPSEREVSEPPLPQPPAPPKS